MSPYYFIVKCFNNFEPANIYTVSIVPEYLPHFQIMAFRLLIMLHRVLKSFLWKRSIAWRFF